MPSIQNSVIDASLVYIRDHGGRIDICSSEPKDFPGVAKSSLANKTGFKIGGPTDAAAGRKVVIPALDGQIARNGNATHWALSDGKEVLLATGALTAPQAVTKGNAFALEPIDILMGTN